jgi:hypothetical protein
MHYQRLKKANSFDPAQRSWTSSVAVRQPTPILNRLQHTLGNRSVSRVIQAKLNISRPGDAYEQEADRVADQVMRMPEPAAFGGATAVPQPPRIQRMCAECEEEVQPKAIDESASVVDQGLESRVNSIKNGGAPISSSLRGFFEPRFGYDFQQVRVHTDGPASEMAHDARASAFTVGRDIVFGKGSYAPETDSGKNLLAHELTHVVQQGYASSTSAASPPLNRAPAPILSRADPQVTTIGMNLGTTPRSGLQFWPTNVTDTRVSPVSARSGLFGGGASQLHVIIAENETIRRLARQLRPFFLTATPFTPSGAAAPLPLTMISEDELAQALLVFNQYYLLVDSVPPMPNWRAGLNFPLPIDIDTATGMATLHPLLIQALAGAFLPAWAALLDVSASATAAPPVATVQADVAAFLTREPSALGRGINLGAQALTNAVAALPFVRETFRQLGAGAFDVAVEFMENLVNTEIELLAAQRDGAAVLAEVRTALGGAPAAPSAQQAAAIARANLMLGRVAGVAAVAPPTSARNRPEKVVNIETVKLEDSNHTPAVDVAVASAIFSQCNVRLAHVKDENATLADSRTWLGNDTDMQVAPSCGSVTADERRVYTGAAARHGLTAPLRAFFVATYSGYTGSMAYSVPPYCATGPAAVGRGALVIQNASGKGDLAHEAVHVLRNSGQHLPDPNLMGANPLSVQLNDAQCTDMYSKV